MAPSKSDRNAGNQPPALPRQNRPDQSPAPQVGNIEQAEQHIEQEVSVAIGRPAGTTITLSPQEMADYEEEMRLALRQPLPDHDDFAHLPLPTPYDPETSLYDWAKAEAWIQEKDSRGQTTWRNRFTGCITYSRPWEVPNNQAENDSTAEQHNNSDPIDCGIEGVIRK